MTSDTEVWRVATRLLVQHGVEAPMVLARRAAELSAKGDEEGKRMLVKIASAIEELLRSEVREDEHIH